MLSTSTERCGGAVHAKISRGVCLIAAYMGLPGAAVRLEYGNTLVKYFLVKEEIDIIVNFCS